MTIPSIGPKGGAGDSGAAPEKVTNSQALRAFGFLLVFVAVGIPLSILLWKVALTWTP